MIQGTEFVTLLLGAMGLAIIVTLLRPAVTGRYGRFFWGLFAYLAGFVFTVVEGFAYGDVLNLLEHVCYAASGLLFAWASWTVRLAVPHAGDDLVATALERTER